MHSSPLSIPSTFYPGTFVYSANWMMFLIPPKPNYHYNLSLHIRAVTNVSETKKQNEKRHQQRIKANGNKASVERDDVTEEKTFYNVLSMLTFPNGITLNKSRCQLSRVFISVYVHKFKVCFHNANPRSWTMKILKTKFHLQIFT